MTRHRPAPKFDLSRRNMLLAAATLAAPSIFIPKRAEAAGVVNVMTYDGMIPPDFKKAFEAETGIEIRLRLVDDQAKQLNLLAVEKPSPQTDIATIAGHRVHQFVDSKFIEPIDLKQLPGWGKIDHHYTESESILIGGQPWGVPMLTGAEVLAYNTNHVKNADSWGVMFDPQYKQRTTYVIEDMISCCLLYLGYDGSFISYLNKPDEGKKAVNAARDLLIKNKSQVRKYYGGGAELQQMLVNEDAFLAQGYAGGLTKLILAGEPIRFSIPKEGSFAFFFNFNVVDGAPNKANAYKLLNAILADPKVGTAMTLASGFMSTITGADAALTDRQKQAFSLPPADLARLQFFRYEGQALKSSFVDPAVQEVKAA